MTSPQKRRHANVRMHVRTQPQLRTQVKLATNKHKNQGSRTLPSQLFSVADFRSLRIYEQLCYCTVSAVVPFYMFTTTTHKLVFHPLSIIQVALSRTKAGEPWKDRVPIHFIRIFINNDAIMTLTCLYRYQKANANRYAD